MVAPNYGTKVLSEKDLQKFNDLFPILIQDLTTAPQYKDMSHTNLWLARVMEYNVKNGKQNRGLATALAYRYFATDEMATDENIHLSYVVGWCVEMLQAFFLVADDIMDGSETRRGQACWYLVDNLGPKAFNDAILLENSIYQLLKKYLKAKPYYVDILEAFQDITFKAAYGQSLDTRTGSEKRMETYTLERYSSIVKYKTSYYSFYLPVSLAMIMTGVNDDEELVKQVEVVALSMGHYFQVQDDYLDCFGDVKVTGKIGTDIVDCKCSWLIVTALEKASPEERQLLLTNYGINEPDKIELIKSLYIKIGLPETYLEYEEYTYRSIKIQIGQLPRRFPKRLFHDMMDKIYRRKH